MKAKCENCGKEIKVGHLATNLTCQACGCTDLSFNCSILAFPVLTGNELGKEVVVKKGESFSSRHSWGTIWKVKEREDLSVSFEEKISEIIEAKPKGRVGLLKTVRKLASPI